MRVVVDAESLNALLAGAEGTPRLASFVAAVRSSVRHYEAPKEDEGNVFEEVDIQFADYSPPVEIEGRDFNS